ncbi:hypothetical protein GCM10009737_03740 [Nocardioides lentus]|uniref:Tryptophan synthase beta chain-like PALP domain-containing protein n=1 Tax=Nocardioides lentus TaxID=338077 RepID=A0ABN2P1I9_9ACTN
MSHHQPPPPPDGPAADGAQAADDAARRAEQARLYGAPVDDLAREMEQLLGIDARELASTLGISAPMLARVREGRRARIGNPTATARLVMLRDFCGHLRAGRASAADVPLTLSQVRAASGPPPSHYPTPQAPLLPRSAAAPEDPFALTDETLRAATAVVRRHVRATPTRRWPLLEQVTGVETWVKHENHCPTGAFKVRGGLVLLDRLLAERGREGLPGLVSATRGNHGQSLAYAGAAAGVPVTIVVPEGNSPDKNRAMEGYGARLVVHGDDFQTAREHADHLARTEGLVGVSAFHPALVAGVATYAAELHASVPDLDVVYVPVGMGSGAAANVAVRDLLGLRTEVVGVVADRAPAYALSHAAGEPVSTETADTVVDGVACRVPDPDAVRILAAGVSRVVRVGDDAARDAMALMYRATHNLAEPAGALSLAGLLADTARPASHTRVAVVHCGGNCDADVLLAALAGAPGVGDGS